ncbi:hypothetical protein SL003B_2953 [Polymorphum gilvum SL003B-26A1]|uniref:Uncharacterized protein n=2 Tax=Polymorphum TaxID=991903 RepID=F2IV45_POLGS|nr:hypothetical protein SL003B_2953 [Polymorphum gilvum SL003B-26A1]
MGEDARFLARLFADLGAAVDPPAGGPSHRAVLRRLVRAARGERTRCRAGHWTGDLNRLDGLHGELARQWARYRAGRTKPREPFPHGRPP